ncbi:porin family protein [uncultured Flavobacterium sp.]|uniref:porin family protein n=1 Tax=uncultured Flavobacterium sp. TaxID=165435 RepID=UPI0030CA2CF2
MKKNTLLIVAILSLSTTIHAQSNFNFGVKAGLNYANFINTEIQTDAITSYHVGILYEMQLFDNLAIQPELFYSTVGATYTNTIENIKSELGYISIPLIAKFNLSELFYIELGPQASFLLINKDDVYNDYNKSDFSVNAGLGINLSKNIFASARYNLGVTEIRRDTEIKNAAVQFSVGFIF